jgi:hypothetical protein
VCLVRSYKSRGVKGGTFIAEDVMDLETHLRRLLDPDAYRAVIGLCPNCGGDCIHALCFRERILRPADSAERPLIVEIRLFRCAPRNCGAVFTVLPAFIARHLWRAWKTVEATSAGQQQPPETTRRRWLSRLASNASQLVQTFASLGQGVLEPSFLGYCQELWMKISDQAATTFTPSLNSTPLITS